MKTDRDKEYKVEEAVVTMKPCPMVTDKLSVTVYIPNKYLEGNEIGSYTFAIREGANWRWE